MFAENLQNKIQRVVIPRAAMERLAGRVMEEGERGGPSSTPSATKTSPSHPIPSHLIPIHLNSVRKNAVNKKSKRVDKIGKEK